MNQSFVVTTSIRVAKSLEEESKEIALYLGKPYVKREKQSLNNIQEKYGVNAIMLVRQDRLSLVVNGKELFFHPGLAKLRIKEIQAGKTDQMIKAMDLKAGDTVLDCTLGLASDAVVASYVAGDQGKVVGIEESIAVAELVRRGLQSYTGEKSELLNAMRRIEVVQTDHLSYLKELPDNVFDVVYFDPMFRVPREKSSSMAPLRPMANSNPLSREVVEEARRVSKKRVVMKETRYSNEFERLQFQIIQGGKYSPLAYGIIVKGGT